MLRYVCLPDDQTACPFHFISMAQQQSYIRLTAGWQAGAAECITRGHKILQAAIDNDDGYLTDKASVFKLLGDLCTFSYHIGPSFFVAVTETIDAATTRQTGVKDVVLEADHFVSPTCGLSLGVGIAASLPSNEPLLQWLSRGQEAYQKVVDCIESNPESASELQARASFDLGFNLFQQV